MATNPAAISENGDSLRLDLVTDSAKVVGLKRGYGAEDIGGNDPAHHQGVAVIPAGEGAVATAAAATCTATLAAVAAKMGYLAGYYITGGGATAGSRVVATITGLAIGTISIDIAVPAGATLAIAPIFVAFPNPIRTSAVNTAIVLSVPSFGTGNLSVTAGLWGYTSK